MWTSATRVEADAWYAELRLPIAALGIAEGEGERLMGFNVARDYNARAAVYYWAPIPPELPPFAAIRYGELRGIEGIGGGRPLVITPYALGAYTDDRERPNDDLWRFKGGGNVAMRLAEDTWGEITILTDFAEVDVDDAVVNLSRFPIFLPEKRPFFLSGLDVFEFGRASQSQLFFSRRIGLEEDVYGGVKLYGRSGNWAYGVLDVITEPGDVSQDPAASAAEPASNWGVARARYSLGKNGHVGALVATRHTIHDPESDAHASDSHYSLGADASFRSDDGRWEATTFGAATLSPPDGALEDEDHQAEGGSAAASLRWQGVRLQPSGSLLYVSEAFDPEVGLVRRQDVLQYEAALPWIERLSWLGLESIQTRTAAQAVTRPEDGQLVGYSSDTWHEWLWRAKWRARISGRFEEDRVPETFELAQRVSIDPGTYRFGEAALTLGSPFVRNPNATLTYQVGTLYGALKHAWNADLTVSLTRHVRLGGQAVLTRLDFPNEDPFLTTAVNTRLVLAATSRLLLTLVGQYDSVAEEWNALSRLRWRYWPGSDLILVYQERLFSGDGRGLSNARSDLRSVLLKISHRFDALL